MGRVIAAPGQVPKFDRSAVLNDGMCPKAGRLARGVRREETGVSLCTEVMGVKARFGTEQDMEELGEPWCWGRITVNHGYTTFSDLV